MADSPTTSSDPGLLLLCIDLQPVFLRAMSESESLQRRCAFAIQAATGMGISVVFTEQVPQKLGSTAPGLIDLVASPTVLAKDTFSALADPVIRDTILSRKPEHVLICGIETSVCVHQTALDALAAGLQVTLLSDCVGARRPDDACTCIAALIRAGVHVLPSETVFYSLLRDVNHPFFRRYTQLVKAHA
jgi:nicotinamidase-related amidase